MIALHRRLRRLHGMSAAEIAHRLRGASRRQVDFLGWILGGDGGAAVAPDEARSRYGGSRRNGHGAPGAGDAIRRLAERVHPELARTAGDAGLDTLAVLADADAILLHRVQVLGFGRFDVGARIDWHRDPVTGHRWPSRHWTRIRLSEHDDRDVKKVWALNLHRDLVTLGLAYAITKDERYAAELAGQLRTWLADNPPGVGVNWMDGIELALRAISWVWALTLCHASPSIDDALATDLAHSLSRHARQIHRYLSTFTSPNTHLIGEACGLFVLGVVLPELEHAGLWRATGQRILETEIERQVAPDGLYREASLSYHCYTLEFYLLALVIGDRNAVALSPELRARVERMLDALRWLARPDGTIPLLGDDDGGRVLRFTRTGYRDVRDLLAIGAIVVGRPGVMASGFDLPPEAWLWLGATARERCAPSTTAPPHGARQFAESGLFVERRAWRGDDRAVLFDCGTLGMQQGAHGHAGCLGVELFAHGRPLVVDPGTYAYNGAQRWRRHFRGTAAHNTVTVDGRDQAEPAGTFQWSTRFTTRVRRHFATGAYVVADVEHDGYERLPEPVTHRRLVVSVGAQYWLGFDAFAGRGTHALDTRFQFPPGAAVRLASPSDAFVTVDAAAGVRVTRLGASDAIARVDDGDEAAPAGWYSQTYGAKCAAPALVFSQRTDVPTTTGFVLFPFRTPGDAAFVIESRHEQGWIAARLTGPAGVDLVYHHANGPAGLSADGLEFRGDFLHVRLGADGAPDQFLACRAHALRWRGRTVFEGRRDVEWIAGRRRDGVMGIDETTIPDAAAGVRGRSR